VSSKALDVGQINTLLKYEENKLARQSSMVHAPKWPSVEGLKALAKAVLEDKRTVTIDGANYRIRRIHKGYVNVSPIGDNLVPCGCFDIESLTSGVH
jgi:hypothetical protein